MPNPMLVPPNLSGSQNQTEKEASRQKEESSIHLFIH